MFSSGIPPYFSIIYFQKLLRMMDYCVYLNQIPTFLTMQPPENEENESSPEPCGNEVDSSLTKTAEVAPQPKDSPHDSPKLDSESIDTKMDVEPAPESTGNIVDTDKEKIDLEKIDSKPTENVLDKPEIKINTELSAKDNELGKSGKESDSSTEKDVPVEEKETIIEPKIPDEEPKEKLVSESKEDIEPIKELKPKEDPLPQETIMEKPIEKTDLMPSKSAEDKPKELLPKGNDSERVGGENEGGEGVRRDGVKKTVEKLGKRGKEELPQVKEGEKPKELLPKGNDSERVGGENEGGEGVGRDGVKETVEKLDKRAKEVLPQVNEGEKKVVATQPKFPKKDSGSKPPHPAGVKKRKAEDAGSSESKSKSKKMKIDPKKGDDDAVKKGKKSESVAKQQKIAAEIRSASEMRSFLDSNKPVKKPAKAVESKTKKAVTTGKENPKEADGKIRSASEMRSFLDSNKPAKKPVRPSEEKSKKAPPTATEKPKKGAKITSADEMRHFLNKPLVKEKKPGKQDAHKGASFSWT